MTKQEFIAKAKAKRLPKEQAMAKFKQLDAAGAFDDSVPVGAPPEVPAEDQSYLQSVAQPAKELFGRVKERSARVGRPTITEKVIPGDSKLEKIAALPERKLRQVGGDVETLGEIPFTAISTLGRAIKPALNLISTAEDRRKLGSAGKGAARSIANLISTKEDREKFGRAATFLGNKARNLPQPVKDTAIPLASIASAVPITKGAKPALNLAKEGVETGVKVSKATGRAAGRAAANVAEGTYRGVGGVAEYLGDVPKETLAAWGLGVGDAAKNIRKYGGKQHETGNKILAALENIDDFIPEKRVVDEALGKMSDINMGNTVRKLRDAKETVAGVPSAVAGNKQIDKMIETIAGVVDENGNLPAKHFKRIREQLDREVNAAFNKDYKSYIETAGVNARNQMMDDLIIAAEKSGNTEYADAMKEWSRKLQIAEKLKGYVGQSPAARERRIDSFVKNIFHENKERSQAVIGDLSELIGDDILTEAKWTAMASQFGPSGKPTLFTPIKTGSILKGGGPAAALAIAIQNGNVPAIAGAAAAVALASPVVSSKILGPLKAFSDMLGKQFKVPKGKVDDVAKKIYREVDALSTGGTPMTQDEIFAVIKKNVPDDIKLQNNPFADLPLAGSARERVESAARKIEIPVSVEQFEDQAKYLRKVKTDIFRNVTKKRDRDILEGIRSVDKRGNQLHLSEKAVDELEDFVARVQGDSSLQQRLAEIGLPVPDETDEVIGWIQEVPKRQPKRYGPRKVKNPPQL